MKLGGLLYRLKFKFVYAALRALLPPSPVKGYVSFYIRNEDGRAAIGIMRKEGAKFIVPDDWFVEQQ